MLMCKQMILTVLVIPLALGAIAKLKRRIVAFRPSADRAFVPRATWIHSSALPHLRLELLPAVYLVRCVAL